MKLVFDFDTGFSVLLVEASSAEQGKLAPSAFCFCCKIQMPFFVKVTNSFAAVCASCWGIPAVWNSFS